MLDAAAGGFLSLGAFPSLFPEPREPVGRARGLVETDHEAPGASSVQGVFGKRVIRASQVRRVFAEIGTPISAGRSCPDQQTLAVASGLAAVRAGLVRHDSFQDSTWLRLCFGGSTLYLECSLRLQYMRLP